MLRSDWRISLWILLWSTSLIPSYMWAKETIESVSLSAYILATVWNTPNIERSPTDCWLPIKALWSDKALIAAWNKSNWYGKNGYVFTKCSASWYTWYWREPSLNLRMVLIVFWSLPYKLDNMTAGSSFFWSKRFWITSSALALVSGIFTEKRPWIREKSCACLAPKSPIVAFKSFCEVTIRNDWPLVLVEKVSAIVCKLSINLTFSAINWPTSSTQKTSRKPGCCDLIKFETKSPNPSISSL